VGPSIFHAAYFSEMESAFPLGSLAVRSNIIWNIFFRPFFNPFFEPKASLRGADVLKFFLGSLSPPPMRKIDVVPRCALVFHFLAEVRTKTSFSPLDLSLVFRFSAGCLTPGLCFGVVKDMIFLVFPICSS